MLLFNIPLPNYLTRVLLTVVNGPRFVLALPFELLYGRRKTNSSLWFKQLRQWITFSPSIVLGFTLYVLLYVLLQQSESVLDVLFATVSLQIFAELSPHFASVAFDRMKASGELASTYSYPTAGFDKVVSYVVQRMAIERSIEVDMTVPIFRHFLREQDQNELFTILAGCLKLLNYRHPTKVTVKFVNYTNGLFIGKNSVGIKAFFNALNKFGDPVLFVTNEDYENLTDEDYLKRYRDIRPKRVRFECSGDQNDRLRALGFDVDDDSSDGALEDGERDLEETV